MNLFRWHIICLFFILSVKIPEKNTWGFFGHKLINRLAVFSLPEDLFPFYRQNIYLLTQDAVKPDKRRYVLETEGPMHYLDMDELDTSLLHAWEEHPAYFDSIPSEIWMEHGALPARIVQYADHLTYAFSQKRISDILRLSAELGHYIGDAHVPLHTTANYDGQLTDQHGIHGLWESRLPELFFDSYDLGGRPARYINDINDMVWNIIHESHQATDSVLAFDSRLTEKFKGHIRSYDSRNKTYTIQYSQEYSREYHKELAGMVERRLRSSIIRTADIWYTCWVNAGQPLLPPEHVDYHRDTTRAANKWSHDRQEVH